jgi:biotin synthase
MGYDLPEYFYEYVEAARKNSNCDIYAFCGPLNDHSLTSLKAAGADGYWCGIEVPNEELFKKIRPGDDYRGRLKTLRKAAELGLKTMSGFLFGVGETQDDIIAGIELLKELEIQSVLVSPLKPMPYTEMEKYSPPSPYEWARVVAITAIYLEKADIFISPDNASWGLRAGVNAFLPVAPNFSGHTPDMDQLIRMRTNVYKASDNLVKEF